MQANPFRWSTLLVYIFVAFGFSWALWVPQALVAQGILPEAVQTNFGWLFSYAAWGPLVGAFAAAWYDLRLAGVKDLLQRAVSVRHSVAWYVLALFLFPLLIGGALWLSSLGGTALPANTMLEETVNSIVANGAPRQIAVAMALAGGAVFIFFMGGPLQEEFGWRGVLLHRLQTRFSPLWASIITGLAWGLWHLPLFFISCQEMYYQRPIWGLLLSTVLVSVIMTGIFNRTRGSIFMALLLHTSFNWGHYAFPTLKSDPASLVLFGALGLAAAIFIWQQRMWQKT